MPRRTYNRRQGRSRPDVDGQGLALARLGVEAAAPGRRRPPAGSRPCSLCGKPMSPSWPYAEHARCRQLSTQPPQTRNQGESNQ